RYRKKKTCDGHLAYHMLPPVTRFSERRVIMASLRKRILPSGEIRWLVDYRDSAGKRRAKQFETKRDADAYMVRARAEVAAGTHVADSQSVTLGEAADLWVESGERDRLEIT